MRTEKAREAVLHHAWALSEGEFCREFGDDLRYAPTQWRRAINRRSNDINRIFIISKSVFRHYYRCFDNEVIHFVDYRLSAVFFSEGFMEIYKASIYIHLNIF
ncbi:hypothetical protein CEXT_573551 [Caerostris extrusa]|uniref:Uncharacterized protein n=1 Tax=Caerostris extrusa TaxID=172846 RepID=A0AAV4SC62_CAEEX|nr:hypothetical protein CEXT_573551 [Caerostris extrusa]